MTSEKSGTKTDPRLRVAIVTASLGSAGAEKQAYYITRALVESGVDVRICTLKRGGEYQELLQRIGVEAKWIGWLPTSPMRASLLAARLWNFRPHVIQSLHAYTNAYSAAAGKLLNALSVGGLRSDLTSCLADNGRLAKCLLAWPDAIAVNSRSTIEQIKRAGISQPERIHFLPNAIDVSAYAERRDAGTNAQDCNCIWVGRLFPAKRVDVFLRALAAARAVEPRIRGTVVGYGPEYSRVRQLGAALGLFPDGLSFLGFREGAGDLLQQADMLVFSSESEGMPNVILEAMAASLPVITTPAGDAADLVREAGAGYVVPFGAVDTIAGAMVRLARSPETRQRLGLAGREYVTRRCGIASLGWRLMKIYTQVARTSERGRPHPLLTGLRAESEWELETSRW